MLALVAAIDAPTVMPLVFAVILANRAVIVFVNE